MSKTHSQEFNRFKFERKRGRNIKTAKTRKRSNARLNQTNVYNDHQRGRLDKITDFNNSISLAHQTTSINDSSNSKLGKKHLINLEGMRETLQKFYTRPKECKTGKSGKGCQISDTYG